MPADLDRAERLAREATAGPWTHEPDNGRTDDHGFYCKAFLRFADGSGRYGFKDADAAFIAEARTLVPQLVAEVRRLREAGEGLAALVEQYVAGSDRPFADAALAKWREAAGT